MIRVDTRSAKAHRFWRYAELIFKTIVFFSGFIAAYLLVKHGF
jgi:hypothetical protein